MLKYLDTMLVIPQLNNIMIKCAFILKNHYVIGGYIKFKYMCYS